MSKCILSVNGSTAMNYLLQTIFKREFEFVPASSAFEAMYQMKRHRQFDVLIVDVDFQAEQNWELIQHIKTSRLFSIPVIVLTTSTSDEVRQKCYEYGIDEIFFKPFNPEDLITVVSNAISAEPLSVTSSVIY